MLEGHDGVKDMDVYANRDLFEGLDLYEKDTDGLQAEEDKGNK